MSTLIDIDRSAKDYHHKHVQSKSTGGEGVFQSHEEASRGMDTEKCYIMAVDSDDLWFVLCSKQPGLRPGLYGDKELDKWFKAVTIKGRISKDKV